MKQLKQFFELGREERPRIATAVWGNGLPAEFDRRLAQKYATLSDQLRRAGDFVANNPIDTASRSLRAVASEAGLAPATFSRLAKALDYSSFDALRDSLRDKIGRQINSFAERAEEIAPGADFGHRHLAACQSNLAALNRLLDSAELDDAATRLAEADRVFLFGALGATGIVEYLSYLAHFCTENWHLVGRQGTSLGGALADIGPRDAFLVVTKQPYSGRALSAAELAHAQGASVIALTDDRACPVLQHATASFIVPTNSPHFYSSYVATLTLLEILIGLVVGRSGSAARDRIARVEQSNRRLEEVSGG